MGKVKRETDLAAQQTARKAGCSFISVNSFIELKDEDSRT